MTIEAYSVMYGADGAPEIGHAAVRLPDGRRAWGNVTDRDAAAAMTREEFCGRPRASRATACWSGDSRQIC